MLFFNVEIQVINQGPPVKEIFIIGLCDVNSEMLTKDFSEFTASPDLFDETVDSTSFGGQTQLQKNW